MPSADPADHATPAAAAPPPPAPPPKRRRWGRRLLIALGVVVVLVAALLGALWWSLGSDAGTGWLLSRLQSQVPGLVIEGAKGSLRGGDFSADRIVVPLPGEPGQPGGSLTLSGVRWSGLAVERLLSRSPYAHLSFKSLEADRADLALPPSKAKKEPAKAPTSLALPVTVDIEALHIGEFHAAALGDKPVRDLRAKVSLGTAEHRIEDLSFAWDRLSGRGAAKIATGGTLDLDARVAVEGDSGDPRLGAWGAQLTARGPLERIETRATLRGLPAAAGGTPAPAGPASAGGAPSAASQGGPAAGGGASAAARPGAARASSAPAAGTGAASPSAAAPPGAAATPASAAAPARAGSPATGTAAPAAAGSRTAAPGGAPATDAASSRRAVATPGGAAGTAAAAPSAAALPSVDVQATLLPFADWPLGALQARTQALDLSALASGLPKTRIDASASATSSAADRPVGVALDLRNALPGRWDEARLPVRSAKVDVRARLDDVSTVELPTLDVQLGNADAPAGRVTGSGRWKAPGWTLDLELADLLPAQLDARAPAMRLSGPAKLRGENFAAAADAVTGAVRRGLGARRRRDRAGAAPAGQRARRRRGQGVARRAAAERRLRHRPRRRAALAAGLAAAEAPARARRRGPRRRRRHRRAPLRRRLGQGARRGRRARRARRRRGAVAGRRAGEAGRLRPRALAAGDRAAGLEARPAPPQRAGEVGPDAAAAGTRRAGRQQRRGAGAQGRRRQGCRQGPANRRGNPLAALAGLRGTASLAVADSVLAGIPLKADAELRSAAGDALQVVARLDAAGNAAGVEGTLDLRGDGAADRWKIDAGAPALARLAPLLKLAGLEGPVAELSGALSADAQLARAAGRASRRRAARRCASCRPAAPPASASPRAACAGSSAPPPTRR